MSQDPTSIGRYQIQRVLGQGAMGTVYLALDPLLKRLVAIKVVHAKGSEIQHTMERFQREAEISARLNHPNVVTVYDVGTDPAVGPFMAMEYVDGTSLSKLIRIGISVEAGMRLLVQGMGALKAAHDAGIVHRDIKPDNILVSQDGRFKLMDFGIARRDESHLTQAGMIFGTPSFTAPELLTGGEASAATDCYAFAVTAFEMVTGRLPFSGSSVGSTLYRIVHDPPTFPVGTKPYVESVFRKALAKKPEDRYPRLSDFMTALVEALDFPEELKLKLLAYITGDQPFSPTQPMNPAVPAERPASGAFNPTEVMRPELGAEPQGGGATLLTPMETQAEPLDLHSNRDPEFEAFLKQGTPEPDDEYITKEILPEGEARPQAPAAEPTCVMPGTLPVPAAPSSGAPETPAEPAPEATAELPVAPMPPPDGTPKPRRGPWLWVAAGAVVVLGLGAALLFWPSGGGASEALPPAQTVAEAPPAVSVPDGPAVDVVSDPEGAEVFLDGESKGLTPLKGLRLPKGRTPRLELRREGYETWSAEVDSDMPFPEVITLTRLGRPARRSR